MVSESVETFSANITFGITRVIVIWICVWIVWKESEGVLRVRRVGHFVWWFGAYFV
ncbi:hypothetical protein RHMOL_Rhmol03G0010400 [Rhododendron molle]|uniref:Uncharacterized protein n=1 Tax=Rhododendron molle TaxID=49168 RepID=A0ACC0PAD5_RHOML|nr:hypothetical protein RHMOL_Rhmol03G0010400 [Rhododendron molle]